MTGSILIGSRLDCLTVSTLRTTSRSTRASRAALQSSVRFQRAAEPRAGARRWLRPIDVHQPEPRKPRRERDRDEEQREQEQARAEEAEAFHQPAADELAEDAALAGRQDAVGARHVQVRKAAAGDEERDEADQAQRRLERRALDRDGAAQDHRADAEQQQRQRVGDDAEQIEREIGDPRAERAAEVVDVVGLADVRPARILRAVAQKAGEQVDRERQQEQERGLAQAFLPVLVEARGWLLCFGVARHPVNLPEIDAINDCFSVDIARAAALGEVAPKGAGEGQVDVPCLAAGTCFLQLGKSACPSAPDARSCRLRR